MIGILTAEFVIVNCKKRIIVRRFGVERNKYGFDGKIVNFDLGGCVMRTAIYIPLS